MTDRRDPERKLKRDLGRLKDQRDAARRELDRTRALVDELQRGQVDAIAGERLLRVDDFYLFVGLENVIGADGRVDEGLLTSKISELLRRRPELGAPVPMNVGDRL